MDSRLRPLGFSGRNTRSSGMATLVMKLGTASARSGWLMNPPLGGAPGHSGTTSAAFQRAMVSGGAPCASAGEVPKRPSTASSVASAKRTSVDITLNPPEETCSSAVIGIGDKIEQSVHDRAFGAAGLEAGPEH